MKRSENASGNTFARGYELGLPYVSESKLRLVCKTYHCRNSLPILSVLLVAMQKLLVFLRTPPSNYDLYRKLIDTHWFSWRAIVVPVLVIRATTEQHTPILEVQES